MLYSHSLLEMAMFCKNFVFYNHLFHSVFLYHDITSTTLVFKEKLSQMKIFIRNLTAKFELSLNYFLASKPLQSIDK